jgi:hypothetical protein
MIEVIENFKSSGRKNMMWLKEIKKVLYVLYSENILKKFVR